MSLTLTMTAGIHFHTLRVPSKHTNFLGFPQKDQELYSLRFVVLNSYKSYGVGYIGFHY
jgi:hypothetical protein